MLASSKEASQIMWDALLEQAFDLQPLAADHLLALPFSEGGAWNSGIGLEYPAGSANIMSATNNRSG